MSSNYSLHVHSPGVLPSSHYIEALLIDTLELSLSQFAPFQQSATPAFCISGISGMKLIVSNQLLG